ncbi:NnrS family protein [Roseovarius phycicola]|uniref:NnrS family protein n=1 Tax=Roseovarius phycicola TaxID=3080976 RepID=A0ABZ2HFD5_9RHOB
MTTTQQRVRAWMGPALFSFGFRPFFLGAAVWAVLSILAWVAMLGGRLELPIRYDIVSWHAHEVLFGYLGAVIAGFLLTAVPNWTGRLPVVGWSLAALAGLWLIGRIAMATSDLMPASAAVLLDLAFPLALSLVAAREIFAGKNWKNLIILSLLLAFLVANAMFHFEALVGYAASGPGLRLGLATALMLVAVVGGRVVPSFTRNWLVKAGNDHLPAPPMQAYDKLALLALLVSLLVWVIWPDTKMTGVLLAVAGILHLIRLARWQGHRTGPEALVWVLHLSYLFIPLGALLHAGVILGGATEHLASTQHVWMIGAVGLMTLAIMTRATLGHTGGVLHAGRGTICLYLALFCAVCLRTVAAFSDDPSAMQNAAAGFWCLSFLGFVVLYGPRLLRPRVTQRASKIPTSP